MERAHMLRSVEAVVSREVMTPVFAASTEQADTIALTDFIVLHQLALMDNERPERIWRAARDVAHRTLDSHCPQMKEEGVHEIDLLMKPYMYAMTAENAMYEGLMTQTSFPLKLAFEITGAAKNRRVAGYEVHSLADIASFLRRPDFRGMVDTAAFTANGVWKDYSTAPTAAYHKERGPELDFVFSRDGTVDFTPRFKAYLRQRLVDVNRQGLAPDKADDIEHAPSSGCPARHLQARFRNTKEDEARLALLGTYFGKSRKELLAVHEDTVINAGLDRLAESLETMHERVETRLAQMDAYNAPRQQRPGVAEYIIHLSAERGV